MATAQKVLAWARSQIGTVETGGPHGNDGNIVPYWDTIKMHGAQGEPWCAAFVLAGLEVAGVSPITTSVYVPQIANDYRRAGRWFPIERALPGDQVVYNWGDGHTGFVVSVDPNKHTVTAIEGNTSADNMGSQDNGGGVYQRVRSWSLVSGVGRPAYDPASPLELKPMFDPALNIVAWKLLPQGLVAVGPDGGVFCEPGDIYRGGPNGKGYWAGMKPAAVDAPNAEEAAAGKEYVIVNTRGQRYAYPE